ncbi:DMT family transporter [Aquabacterium sp.]|uniref:DMT family transporter n=1 Tax=Aquabacterium sp. TaxID=1872578 RepID=UPI002E34C3FE|nr:DMT family transporter [Aquabacterium sp.]HEX5312187.1 DMT family transporter [Aquabacterium sp.]
MATTRTQQMEGLLCALAGAIAFSGKAIVAKLIYRMGGDAIAVVGMRMTLALPLFLVMAWWAQRGREAEPLERAVKWQIAGLGVTGYYLASTLDFLGLQYISANLERAILYLNPTMVLVLSALWFRRPIALMQLLALGVAYAGVSVVWWHDWTTTPLVSEHVHSGWGVDPSHALTLGSLLVLGSALSYALYLMGSGALVQRHGSLWLVGRASSVACVLCMLQWGLVYAATSGEVGRVSQLGWQAWALSAVNAVFCTALPVWLVMRGVQLLGATSAAQVGMVGPLSTIWMAAWTLGEPITPRLLLGTGTIVIGILLLTRVSASPQVKQAANRQARSA